MSDPKKLAAPSLIQPTGGEAKMRKPTAPLDEGVEEVGEGDIRIMCHLGVICVVGRTASLSPVLVRVAARIFYQKDEPTDLSFPPAGGYTEGTAFADAQTWPGPPPAEYNFRFVRCENGEDQEVAGGRGSSSNNWLVIWGQFDGSDDMVVIHGPDKLKLIAANDTNCGTVNCGQAKLA